MQQLVFKLKIQKKLGLNILHSATKIQPKQFNCCNFLYYQPGVKAIL